VPVNYSGDPILQRIRSLAQADLEAAQADALKSQKDLLMQLGAPKLVRGVFGVKNPKTGNYVLDAIMKGGKLVHKDQGEKSFLQAVRQNPTSQLGTLQTGYKDTVRQTEADLNSRNLFYSGTRGRTLADLLRERNSGRAQLVFGAQQGLDSILRNLLASKQTYRQTIGGAEEAAYQRALAQQISGVNIG
jgi:hypothetical protein